MLYGDDVFFATGANQWKKICRIEVLQSKRTKAEAILEFGEKILKYSLNSRESVTPSYLLNCWLNRLCNQIDLEARSILTFL